MGSKIGVNENKKVKLTQFPRYSLACSSRLPANSLSLFFPFSPIVARTIPFQHSLSFALSIVFLLYAFSACKWARKQKIRGIVSTYLKSVCVYKHWWWCSSGIHHQRQPDDVVSVLLLLLLLILLMMNCDFCPSCETGSISYSCVLSWW